MSKPSPVPTRSEIKALMKTYNVFYIYDNQGLKEIRCETLEATEEFNSALARLVEQKDKAFFVDRKS